MITYVAGPYSTDNTTENVHDACHAGAFIMSMGGVPIVPHLSIINDIVTPMPYEEWMRVCLEVVTRCDAILRLPGESPGADREEQAAQIPVFTTPEEWIKWHTQHNHVSPGQWEQGMDHLKEIFTWHMLALELYNNYHQYVS